MKLTFAGIDPAMNNTGVAIGQIDLATADWDIIALKLIQPPKLEKAHAKLIRKSSNDLARVRHTYEELTGFLKLHGVTMVFAEIPVGSQSARACLGAGTAIGVLAGLPQTVVEVTPAEVKIAVGEKYAAKEYMIEWATKRWPDLPWLRYAKAGKTFKKGDVMLDNEHLADACAAISAGMKTQEFRQAFTLSRALMKSAA